MTNTNPLETQLALEAENRRLREILKRTKKHTIKSSWPHLSPCKYCALCLNAWNICEEHYSLCVIPDVDEILSQPTVTTGLLGVVEKAIKFHRAAGEAYFDQLDKNKAKAESAAGAELLESVEALPPDVRAMVEALR